MEDTTRSTAPAGTFTSGFGLFKPSIDGLTFNAGALLGAILVPSVLAVLAGIPMAASADGGTNGLGLGLLGVALSVVLSIVLQPVIIIASLKSARKQHITFGEAFTQGKPRILRLFGLELLMGLIIVLGFICLIVPGVFMLRRYLLAPYFLIDQDLSIGDALKRSAAVAKEFSSPMWGITGVVLLIGLLSAFRRLGFIGAIVGVLYTCAPAIRYTEVLAAQKTSGSKKAKEVTA